MSFSTLRDSPLLTLPEFTAGPNGNFHLLLEGFRDIFFWALVHLVLRSWMVIWSPCWSLIPMLRMVLVFIFSSLSSILLLMLLLLRLVVLLFLILFMFLHPGALIWWTMCRFLLYGCVHCMALRVLSVSSYVLHCNYIILLLY